MAVPPQYIAPSDVPRIAEARYGGASLLSGIAAGAEQVGEAAFGAARHDMATDQKVAELEQQRTQMEQRAAGAVAFGQMRSEMAQHIADLRAAPAPGGAGHVKAVADAYDGKLDALMAPITDPEVRSWMIGQVANYGAELYSSETEFQAHQARVKLATDADTASDTSANLIRAMTDPKAVDAEEARWNGFVDGLPAIGADDKEKLRRAGSAKFVRAMAEGALDRGDFEGARTIARSNKASMLLAPETVDTVLSEADALQHRQEAAARAEAAAGREVARDQLGAVEQHLNDGEGTIADRTKLADQYAALGDQSKAEEWRQKAVSFGAVQKSRDWTLPQMRGEVDRLTAKKNAGGLGAGEGALLTGLSAQLNQSQERLNRSGGAIEQYVYATGKPLPPIDLTNPASLRARAELASAAAAKYGLPRVEPLEASELTGLRQLLDNGPAGQMQALQVLAGFGDARSIAGAARQIAPDQGQAGFRIAATLMLNPHGSDAARMILRGPEALKGNAKVLPPAQAQAVFRGYVPALAGMGADYFGDTFEAAKAHYAATMQAQGQTEWSEPQFRASIEAVLGGYQDGRYTKGGTAMYQGQRVAIPSGWTADGVLKRFARIDGGDLAHIRVSGAGQWPDGSPLYSGQLRELIPVYRGPGANGAQLYSFKSPSTGRLLQAKGGGDYVIDAAKVPWRD